MDAASGGPPFKSEPVRIKQEPGVYIKSEFGPSLASLPMAPATRVKKENGPSVASLPMAPVQGVKQQWKDDKKSVC